MATFNVYLKDSSSTRQIGSYSTEKQAIDRCLEEVKRTHSSECALAKEGLEIRGYYCMGYSSREVYIEEA